MRRVTDFARGSHVPAATLNAVQDEQRGLVGATANPSGALALKGTDGRYVCTPDAGVANNTLAVLDTGGIDWRNRALWGVLIRLESAAQRLHGADAWQANDTTRPVVIRRFEGRTGSGAVGAASATVANGTPPVIASGSFAVVVDELATAALRVYLYARPSDGALCVYNASGATLHAELFVEASAAAPTPGVTPPTPIPTLTNLLWLTPTVYASRPSNPGADVRGVHRSTDTGEVALWDGGAWRVLMSSTVNATQLQGRDVASTAPSDGQALLWSTSNSRWQPGTVSGGSGGVSTVTYTFAGGAHDYTGDSDYNPAGATSVESGNLSGLLGDGSSVPLFSVFGRDRVSALARTTTPALRITLDAQNGEPLLRGDSTSDSGVNLLIPLPYWCGAHPNWRVDLTVATNLAASLCTAGSDFASLRVGLGRQHTSDGILTTVCVADVYTYAGDGGGAMREGRTMDGAADTATDLSGETSGGVNVRAVRITRAGPRLTLETGANTGALSVRRDRISYKRRGAPQAWVLIFAMGQGRGTPTTYWGDLRTLTITPLP